MDRGISLAPSVYSVQFHDVDGDGIDERLETRNGQVELRGIGGVWWSGLASGTFYFGDADGDGVSEIVASYPSISSYHYATHQVFDAATGMARGPAAPGRHCRVWHEHDHDADGVSQLLCAPRVGSTPHTVFDPMQHAQVHYRGQSSGAVQPLAGDFDGDGTAEVLWTWEASERRFQDRVVLRDGRGAWLDMMPIHNDGRAIHVLDTDGDGDGEMLRGLDVWDWSPSTSWVQLPPIVAATTFGDCVHSVIDLDLDGHREVVFDGCTARSTLSVLDLLDGGNTTLARYLRRDGHVGIVDLDGDGHTEIVVRPENGDLRVFRADGTVMATWPNGDAWALVHHQGRPFLLVGAGGRTASSSRGDVAVSCR